MRKKILLIIFVVFFFSTGCRLRLKEKLNNNILDDNTNDIIDNNDSNNDNNKSSEPINNSNDNNNSNGSGSDSISEDAKKTIFLNTVLAFINSVRMKVIEGRNFNFFSTDRVYMVPVGDNDKSCVQLEGSTSSGFSDTWKYAFVGVKYDGSSYKYYFMGQDGSGHGLRILSEQEINSNGKKAIYSGYANDITQDLISLYNRTFNNLYDVKDNKIIRYQMLPIDLDGNTNYVFLMSKKAGCNTDNN